MKTTSFVFGATLALVVSAGSVQAAEKFTTLSDIPTEKMTAKQTEAVRGANHVIRLVLFRTGQESLPTAGAIQATTVAGSRSGAMGVGGAQDRARIVGLLP